MPYVREQGLQNSKIPAAPPRFWLNFLATSGRRARVIVAHENYGEVLEERSEDRRFFDLRPTPMFAALADRVVIEWTKDPVNWAKTGDQAASVTVVEISDPATVPFPGFESVLVSFGELQAVISDDRYSQWQTALSSVQGIYLIADTSTGRLYVGKADGAERFLGRWKEYASNGHGGNVSLRELAAADAKHRQRFSSVSCRSFPRAPHPRRWMQPRPTSSGRYLAANSA